MPSILIVCTANMCRSPMAMGLLREMVMNDEAEWRIQSAGIWAEDGNPPSQNTLLVLSKRGIDINNYRSRQLTEELLDAHNLILTMERGQKEALKTAFPRYASRIHLLSEMVGKNEDIVDPVGRSLADYEHTAQEISDILTRGFERLRTLATNKDAQNHEVDSLPR